MQQRAERVSSMLMKEVSQAILEDVQEEGMGFLTVIRADVTKDLKMAKIIYSVLGDKFQQEKTEKIIIKNAKFIKRLVNDRMQLRYAIDLRFVRVEDQEESIRVQQLLDKIRDERKQKGDAAGA